MVTPASTGQVAAEVINPDGRGCLVLVCEHATNRIPSHLNDLGLTGEVQASHAAWDPGALALARYLSQQFDSPLVAAGWSRLVYDCNRPPASPTAIVESTDGLEIPGNQNLTQAEREERVDIAYKPFVKTLVECLAGQTNAGKIPAVITVHSFTPVFNQQPRTVELGLLHDTDSRLADAMLRLAPEFTTLDTRRNEPYSAADGVTHTLQEHALPQHLPNVMLELRNDLLRTEEDIETIGFQLASLIKASLVACHAGEERAAEGGH